MKIVVNFHYSYWCLPLFIFIFNRVKICPYSYFVVLPLNSRWIAVELILAIKYWIFRWILNFPLNGFLLFNIEYSVECWISFFNLNFFACWNFVNYRNLNFKVLLLNIEFLLKIGIVPQYWISKYWILKFHWGFDSDWTLNFHHWTLNFLKGEV